MTQKKPIIGITPSHNTENNDTSLRPTYPKAIAAAGGLPILLPLECSDEDIKQFMDVCDGFLFTGGPDINPFLFGEDTHLKCGNISAARDHLEFRLLSAAMDAGKPIFGICRGVQVLNVGLGGSLYQDIPSQTEREFPIAHQQPFYYNIPCHRVNITENTLLHSICHGETQIAVNSSHHQCVHIPAPGLRLLRTVLSRLLKSLITRISSWECSGIRNISGTEMRLLWDCFRHLWMRVNNIWFCTLRN